VSISAAKQLYKWSASDLSSRFPVVGPALLRLVATAPPNDDSGRVSGQGVVALELSR
jgi:hypothetical protein